MSSIDQRIVQMQFDNKQFESGIKTSLKSLDSLKKGLNLDSSAKSLEKLKQAGRDFNLASIASGVDKITKRFSAMGIAGVVAMQRITNAAITTGKKIVSALTIDPVRSGLREYETQINAIQTIMSNTRKDFASSAEAMTAVNNALDQLNKYADMTIYNFTEMTRNIGTFTAAGVKLETATAAIKGIANLGAVSGSSSQQVSTAMYQLSQALAAGTVRLMDWNSLVNAGMGGQVLQDALKETARVHGVAIDKMIEEEGSFRETLQKGWLTSQIMLETLEKFTGDLTEEQILALGYTKEQAKEIIALGQDAKNAATKVKTFTQLIDTLKEALGSGWAQSWEYIIGNFEEARELWTMVSDAIGGVINRSSEARNELLKGWHDAGGREDLIKGLVDIFSALWGVVVAVGDAMDDIFPETTVDNLLAISAGIREFGENLKQVLKYWDVITGYDTIENTIEGMNVAIDLARNLRDGLSGDDVKLLQERLSKLGYNVGEIDGIFGPKTEAALKEFQKKMGIAVDGIFGKESAKSLSEALGIASGSSDVEIAAKHTLVFGETLDKVQRIARGAFAVFNIGKQIFATLGSAFSMVGKSLKPLGDALLTIGAAFGDWLVGVNESLASSGKLEEWLKSFETALIPFSEKISKASESLLQFFGIGEAVENAEEEALTFQKIVDSIKGLFTGDESIAEEIVDKPIGVLTKIFTSMKEAFGKIKTWLTADLSSVLGEINIFGTVTALVATALFASILSAVNQFKKIGKNINKLITSVKDVVSGFNKKKFTFGDAASSILKIAAAVALMAAVVYAFSKMDAKSIVKGIASIVAVMGTLVIAMVAFNYATRGFKNADKVMNSMLSLTAAIGILTAAVYVLGKMDMNALIKGLVGLGALLLELSVFMLIAGKAGKVKNTFGIAVIAASILILTKAIKQLGAMNAEELIRGIAALGAVMLELALFMFIANKVSAGIGNATEILAMAAAIMPIVDALNALGTIDTKTLIKGIVSLGAVLLELGVFTKIASDKVSISTSIALLATVAAVKLIISAIRELGTEDTKTLIKGISSIGAVMLAMGVFLKALSVINPNTKAMIALLPMAAAIDLLILGFNSLIKTMRDTDGETLKKGLLSFASIMVAFGIFMKSLSAVNPNIKAMLGLVPAAAALDLIMLGFIAVIRAMKDTDSDALIKGLISFGGVMLAFGIFMKALGAIRPNLKAMLAMIPAAIALSGVVLAFAFAVNKIKDVDSSKIESFASSLAMLTTSFGIAVAAMGLVGFGGVAAGLVGLLGIVAVISAVVAAFAGLSKIDGFQEFMNGGAESIGSIIGSFVGAFQASKLIALSNGLSHFSNVSIDENAIDNALDAVQKIADFENALPEKGVGQRIADFILGSNLENFSSDVTAFATAATDLSTAMEHVSIDPTKVQTAVDAASLINGLASAIESISIGETVANVIAGGTPFELFVQSMPVFADGVSAMNTALSTITIDLTSIQTAVDAADLVNGLASSIKTISVTDAIANIIAGGQPFALFCQNMTTFSDSVTNLQNGVKGISQTSIVSDTETAAAAAKAIGVLIEELSGMNIEANKGAIAKFFTGDTKAKTVFDDIGVLAGSISAAAKGFSGLSDTKIIDDTDAVKNVVTKITELLAWISSDEVIVYDESDTGDATTFNKIISQIGEIATTINDFNAKTKDVDHWKFKSLIDSVVTGVNTLNDMSSMTIDTDNIDGIITGVSDVGAKLSTALSSGFGEASADTGSVTIVGDSMLTTINSYQDDFETAGLNLGRGLAQGMRNSRAIAAAAAVAVAKAALNAAKAALGIHSPSKEFEKFGMYSDQGFAAGLTKYSDAVTRAAEGIGYSALNSLRSTLDNLSTIINSDIDTTPVIRPVMDLSDVSSGANAISSMLSGTSAIGGYMGTSSRILASSINASTKDNQNGSAIKANPSAVSNDNSINFPNATFNMRSDQDIYSLASEIAMLAVSQQRSLGAAVTNVTK